MKDMPNLKLKKMFTAIAQEHLGIETLEIRHDVGVSSLQRALLAAYEAGKKAGSK